MPELAALQARIWQLVTAPSGVASALAEESGAEAGDLAGWLATDTRVPAVARLDVYAHAYFQRIHDVLAEDFGALRANLGDDGFHDLVTAFLCVHPPERPSLRHAGDRLAGFLAEHRAAQPFRQRWPFAADLARFERALTDSFDAPDAAPLRAQDLASIPPDDWAELVLELHPSVRLPRHHYAVLPMREAWDADGAASLPVAIEPGEALVWRARERTFFRWVDAEEAELLTALQRGVRFGELCELVAARLGEEEAPARAAGWLQGWVSAGLITSPGR
jgi:hypothetical protein